MTSVCRALIAIAAATMLVACGGNRDTRPERIDHSRASAGSASAGDAPRAGTCYVIDLQADSGEGTDGYYSYPPPEPVDYDPAAGGGGGGWQGGSIGSLPPGAARCYSGVPGAALDPALPAIRTCFDAQRAGEGPTLGGRIVVESLANGDGVVRSARVRPDSDPAFNACIDRAMRAIKIPRTDAELEILEAYRESAEFADREMAEALEVPEPPVRPIVCGLHTPALEPSPSVTMELTPTAVSIDGEHVVDTTLLQDPSYGAEFDRALSWISARIPAAYLVPEADWSLALRALPGIDTDLIDLVLSYLSPTSVYFARGVGTSDEWSIVNPAGTPGWSFCDVGQEEFAVRITLYGEGRIQLAAFGGAVNGITAAESGRYDLSALRERLDALSAGPLAGRTDAVVVAGQRIAYRDLINIVEVAVASGFVDTAFWAASYPDIQEQQDARLVDP